MLCGPRQPIDDVAVNVVVARGQYLIDVLAQEAPLPGLGFDAPPRPKIQPAIDDRLAGGFEGDAAILPALAVAKPPLADVDGAIIADHDAAVEIQISEVMEFQKCRHA